MLEFNAPVAVSMRHEVFAMVEQGKSSQDIMDFMASRYGEFVRYNLVFNLQTLILFLNLQQRV